jgi:hypothetical protein
VAYDTGFTKSFELVKPGLVFLFIKRKKSGILYHKNDIVSFYIFLLQFFSQISSDRGERAKPFQSDSRFCWLATGFSIPLPFGQKYLRGGGAWGHESHEATALEVSTRRPLRASQFSLSCRHLPLQARHAVAFLHCRDLDPQVVLTGEAEPTFTFSLSSSPVGWLVAVRASNIL